MYAILCINFVLNQLKPQHEPEPTLKQTKKSITFLQNIKTQFRGFVVFYTHLKIQKRKFVWNKKYSRQVNYFLKISLLLVKIWLESSTNTENPKKFWSFIKSIKQEVSGVAPLRNTGGIITSDPQAKANILNDQFKSVFTTEDTSHAPDKGPIPFLAMNSVSINPRGVSKLLGNLQPGFDTNLSPLATD